MCVFLDPTEWANVYEGVEEYLYVKQIVSRLIATRNCADYGGNLATILSQEEDDFVKALISPG